MVKKFQDRFSRLDTIPACDGQTNTTRRQRPRYAERRAGKKFRRGGILIRNKSFDFYRSGSRSPSRIFLMKFLQLRDRAIVTILCPTP